MSDSMGLPKYNKPWKSIADQLSMLESRGLKVLARDSAEKFLSHLGYYRFSGYCLAFEDVRHQFRNGTTFENVQFAYEFDVKLRDLFNDALEAIEVDVRSSIALIFGSKAGAFGHLQPENFKTAFGHSEWIKRVREDAQRSSEVFVLHFKKTYCEFPDLPCWTVTEVMSFGALSKMYDGLRDEFQSPIANRYGVQKEVLQSTLHHFSYVRNICAHHARLWDRRWKIVPRVPEREYWKEPWLPNRDRLFVTLLLINRTLLKCQLPDSYRKEWRRRATEIVKNAPATAAALYLMGMTPEWYKHPLWI